ncbi:MAG: hypothetical protein ACKO2P_06800 [Planctomycetota bacterium]
MQRFLTFLPVLLLTPALLNAADPTAAEFRVWSVDASFQPPEVIVQHDPQSTTGIDWNVAVERPWYEQSDARRIADAAGFLVEGIERMTACRLTVRSSNDLTRGIILTTLSGASADIRSDPAVLKALQNDGRDPYNHNEAWFIRSEPRRLLIVANTVSGLVCAVPEVLESVGYEVLAMGPNWVHVPAGYQQQLSFRLCRSGRPSYYIRGLSPTSGQSYGVGTILDAKLLHQPTTTPADTARIEVTRPSDETVDTSWSRWAIGRRLRTQSMPGFPGHAMQSHHRALIAHIRATGDPAGFLGTVLLGDDAERPAATDANRGSLWINRTSSAPPAARPAFDGVYLSDGREWRPANLEEVGLNLDLSVPVVRQIILDAFLDASERHFRQSPDELFVFGTDPEDGGGYADLARWMRNPNWYPEVLAAAGRTFGRPYLLHGMYGLDQPKEIWDAAAPGDTVFGLNNWLLAEYDAWLAARPPGEQVTSTGRLKRDAVRCSLYSYNYHDVPPNFNPDPRIRVMIASYPKHRGRGKWKQLATQTDLARAFQTLLPREPSGDYWIISLSFFQDRTVDALAPAWDASPEFLVRRQQEHFAAGFRALSAETDFNFGRLGLGYYLLSQVLLNTQLTATELHALRDRWLQRAFGSGWTAMKDYYDYLLTANYPVNSPSAWARAVRFIEAADQLIDPASEPAAQRRLDDIKQYWYFYFLVDSKQDHPGSTAMRELFWKGQMSYANASHMIARTIFSTSSAAEAASRFAEQPAHFTAAETAKWWPLVLEHWPVVDVSRFADATLHNGQSARDFDLHDLVAVAEFGAAPVPQAFLYNAGYQKPPTFLTVASAAGEEIGFHLYWPADPTGKDGYYLARDLPCGISLRNPQTHTWESLVDRTVFKQPSKEIQLPPDNRLHHLATVRFLAPTAGTYRFEIGYGGNLAFLTDLGFDPRTSTHTGGRTFTFDCTAEALTQTPAYLYLPKDTKTLDFEVWDSYGVKTLTLYSRPAGPSKPGSLVPQPAQLSRSIDIGSRGTHRIDLQPHETGTLATISGNGFAFPYVYSVPLLWAKSPAQLLVPRGVATADGLTIR